MITETPINPYYLLFIFCATIGAYSFQRILKSRDDFSKTKRHHWIDEHRKLLTVIFILATLVGASCIFTFPPESLYFIIPIGIISGLYAGHFLRFIFPKTENLRTIPHLKIYLIAISWTFLTAGLPFYNEYLFFDITIILLMCSNFLMIWGITIPFDIRDVDVDAKSQKTFPQIFGIMGAKVIGIGLLVAAYMQLTLYFVPGLTTTIAMVVSSALVYFSDPKRKELYYTFWVEGSIILWSGAVILDYCYR